MKQLISTVFILIILSIITSCACSNNCEENNNYEIEYYSGGGFTGFEQGISVNCSGLVQFWKKNLNSSREITDSLKLSDDQLNQFNKVMGKPGVFSYTHKYTGNMTAYLTFIKKDQNNIISFNPAEIPQDMPSDIKDILSEIKKINNK